jgi:hypothetical protein
MGLLRGDQLYIDDQIDLKIENNNKDMVGTKLPMKKGSENPEEGSIAKAIGDMTGKNIMMGTETETTVDGSIKNYTDIATTGNRYKITCLQDLIQFPEIGTYTTDYYIINPFALYDASSMDDEAVSWYIKYPTFFEFHNIFAAGGYFDKTEKNFNIVLTLQSNGGEQGGQYRFTFNMRDLSPTVNTNQITITITQYSRILPTLTTCKEFTYTYQAGDTEKASVIGNNKFALTKVKWSKYEAAGYPSKFQYYKVLYNDVAPTDGAAANRFRCAYRALGLIYLVEESSFNDKGKTNA